MWRFSEFDFGVFNNTLRSAKTIMSDESKPSKAKSNGLSPLFGLLTIAALAVLTVNVFLLKGQLRSQQESGIEHQFWVVSQPGFSASQRREALQKLVRFGNLEWRSADLTGLDMAGAQLPAAILNGSDFQNTKFTDANLSRIDLSLSVLKMVDFSDANLGQANLNNSDLYRANLTGSILNKASLQATVFQEAKLIDAKLLVADLSEADLLMADCTGADFSGANLSSARLEATVMRGVNLSLARLGGANLKDADFTDSNWWRARELSGADLARLTKDFSPTTNAPPKLIQDFAAWLNSGR